MEPKNVKKIAAKIFKIGTTRVWLSPQNLEQIASAITKDDIRGMIAEGIIKKQPEKGISSARANALRLKKKKGRRKGFGKRAGTRKARTNPKKKWQQKVRALRQKLSELRKAKTLKADYQKTYRLIKGNFFRDKKHLETYALKGE